ncbi:hypothetical protein E2C01_017949 [Portunus trituberculatus]|uniref:Uncharacterized protein n=1 Tax=Portunus trituberculatus TaxID=210409 RepID=A0A5B7DU70_PORTR|nr:hypothetical protein [Portunus trituberculatus]
MRHVDHAAAAERGCEATPVTNTSRDPHLPSLFSPERDPETRAPSTYSTAAKCRVWRVVLKRRLTLAARNNLRHTPPGSAITYTTKVAPVPGVVT